MRNSGPHWIVSHWPVRLASERAIANEAAVLGSSSCRRTAAASAGNQFFVGADELAKIVRSIASAIAL
jgi:hypothetical protein